MLGMMGAQLAGEGFETAEGWLSAAGLSDREATSVANGLNHWQTKDDTGEWIEWMAGALPAEALPQWVEDLVSQWTRDDYKAIAEKVFLLTDAKKTMRELGQTPPDGAMPKFTIMGKVFDPAKPDEYLKTFAVARAA